MDPQDSSPSDTSNGRPTRGRRLTRRRLVLLVTLAIAIPTLILGQAAVTHAAEYRPTLAATLEATSIALEGKGFPQSRPVTIVATFGEVTTNATEQLDNNGAFRSSVPIPDGFVGLATITATARTAKGPASSKVDSEMITTTTSSTTVPVEATTSTTTDAPASTSAPSTTAPKPVSPQTPVPTTKSSPTPNAPTANGQLTKADLGRVKNAKVYFAHNSVGRNIMSGVPSVFADNGVSAPRIIGRSEIASSAGGYFAHDSIGGNGSTATKNTTFSSIMNGGVGSNVDVAFLKYCYVDVGAGESKSAQNMFNEYKATMDALSAAYPRVKMLHFTAPLTTQNSASTQLKREQFNSLMRKQYESTGRLVDIARIESTDPAGKRVTGSSGGQTYYLMYSGYTDDGGHLNTAGQKAVATEMLRVISRALG